MVSLDIAREVMIFTHSGSGRYGFFLSSSMGPSPEANHTRDKAFIERYDSKSTLFYLDPPYFGCEKDYGRDMFSREEFQTMAGILGGIKGRFILSLNDRPEVRKTFQSFYIQSVSTTYTIGGGGKAKPVGEVLISNLKLSRV